MPSFFVATQFFYTLSFIAMLIAIIFVVMYLLCVDEYYRVNVLRWTGIDLIIGGAFGTVALIISVPLGTVGTLCLTGNTITFPGPLAWLLLVLSSIMFPAFFFWSRPASFEGKRLLGRNNILWSREFKKHYLDINKIIINANASWHC